VDRTAKAQDLLSDVQPNQLIYEGQVEHSR